MKVMHNEVMRTTVNLDEDVHEYATVYANANGISLSAALNEIVRKAEGRPSEEPLIVFSSDGFPMFPPTGGRITSEMVRKIEAEEFDPKNFT
jgi:hypothetical protein